jgi:hypothetical protein
VHISNDVETSETCLCTVITRSIFYFLQMCACETCLGEVVLKQIGKVYTLRIRSVLKYCNLILNVQEFANIYVSAKKYGQ